MAYKAGVDRRLHQLLGVVGHMRIVAGKALSFGFKSAVLYFDLTYPLLFIFMAPEAEILRGLCRQIILEIAGMRTVTVDAFVLNRLVHKFLAFKRLCFIYMAGEAHFIAGSIQHPGIIRLMRIVAHSAPPDRHGPVDKLSGGNLFIMTHKAEIHPLAAKLEFIR